MMLLHSEKCLELSLQILVFATFSQLTNNQHIANRVRGLENYRCSIFKIPLRYFLISAAVFSKRRSGNLRKREKDLQALSPPRKKVLLF